MRYNRKLFSFDSGKARKMLMLSSMDLHGHEVILDVYNGRTLDTHIDKWHAEHIFPLKSAWDMGFNKQYREDPNKALEAMESFANDPYNLTVTSASSNISRGTKTIWNWSPLNLGYVPVRNMVIRDLAEQYDLSITASQKWAMDWSDNKIKVKYRYGIHLGKVRSWLIQHGFYKFLMPF